MNQGAHTSLHKSPPPMINSYLMTTAIVRKRRSILSLWPLFPPLLGRDNWFLCGNKVSTTHGSRLRRWFDWKEGWRESRGQVGGKKSRRKEGWSWRKRQSERAEALKANKPDSYLQFSITKKISLALGGCKLDNNLFFGALTGLNAEHSLVHRRCMSNSPNGKAYWLHNLSHNSLKIVSGTNLEGHFLKHMLSLLRKH